MLQIEKLVRIQPEPGFFYKSFLEFNGGNFITMLAFSSGSIEALLSDDNKEHFDPNFPIIYKTKI